MAAGRGRSNGRRPGVASVGPEVLLRGSPLLAGDDDDVGLTAHNWADPWGSDLLARAAGDGPQGKGKDGQRSWDQPRLPPEVELLFQEAERISSQRSRRSARLRFLEQHQQRHEVARFAAKAAERRRLCAAVRIQARFRLRRARARRAAGTIWTWWKNARRRVRYWRMTWRVWAIVLIQSWWRAEAVRRAERIQRRPRLRLWGVCRLKLWASSHRKRLQRLAKARASSRPADGAERPPLAPQLQQRAPLPGSPAFVFDRARASDFVTVSQGGLWAETSDPTGQELYGVVFGTAPIPETPAGLYFEVRVERTCANKEDGGLTLGATAVVPRRDQVADIEVAALVLHSWTLGYKGEVVAGVSELPPDFETQWEKLGWNPAELEVGDCLGLLVTRRGEARLFLNGDFVAQGPRTLGGVLRQRPLYAVVDLLGSAAAVSLLPGAGPPASCRAPLQPGRPLLFGPHFGAQRSGHARLVRRAQGDSLVFGSSAVPQFPAGWYFELRVEEMAAASGGVLSIGVTDRLPPPGWAPSADRRLPGAMWHLKSQSDFAAELREGDTVGFLVAAVPDGELRAFVNGYLVARGQASQPPTPGSALYPFAAFSGDVLALSFAPGLAPPPASADGAADAPPPARGRDVRVFSHFLPTLAGDGIALSFDCLFAERRNGAAGSGLLLGDGAVAHSPAGPFFEVEVVRARPGFDEGLAIGVTTRLPHARGGVADDVCDSWSFGFDGQARLRDPQGRLRTSRLDWRPGELREGDRVGLLVKESGDQAKPSVVQIFVNCAVVAQRRLEAALTWLPLYPLVELLGGTEAVRLVPGASPPDAARVLSVFDSQRVGANLLLSPDGRALRRRPGQDGFCVAFGDAPIASSPAAAGYFEVRVDAVRPAAGAEPDEADGLALGVAAARLDAASLAGVGCAEDVPQAWTVGYDGQAVNPGPHGISEVHRVAWRPASLGPGQRVGLLLARDGRLLVLVDGQVVAQHPVRCPLGPAPLYAVVDLLGRTAALSLVPGAAPPAAPPPAAPRRGVPDGLRQRSQSSSTSRTRSSLRSLATEGPQEEEEELGFLESFGMNLYGRAGVNRKKSDHG